MADQSVNLKIKLTPELEVKMFNVVLRELKASLGEMGKDIKLLDEKKISNEFKKIADDAALAASKTRSLGDETQKVKNRAVGLGKAFSFTQMAMGIQLFTQAISQFTTPFVELDKQIQNVGTLGVKNLEAARNAVMELSTSMPESAEGLGAALYQGISAGTIAVTDGVLDIKNAMGFLDQAARVGVAGMASTESAVDGLTSVINAYGLELSDTEKVSDTFFAGIKLGKTTFNEMNSSLASFVPMASAMGVGFDQATAAIASLTAMGTPTAQAGTQMNAVFSLLQKGTTPLNAALAKSGTNLAALRDKLKEPTAAGGGLIGVMRDIQKAADASGKQLASLTGRVEAASIITSLAKDDETYKKSLDTFLNVESEIAGGAASKAYAVAADSIAVKTDILSNQIQHAFNSVFSTIGSGATTALNAATQLAPVLIAMSGMKQLIPEKFITGIKGLPKSMGLASKATKGMAAAQRALNLVMMANPWILAAAGAAALALAAYGLYQAFKETAEERLENTKAEQEHIEVQKRGIEVEKQRVTNGIRLMKNYSDLAKSQENIVDKDKKMTVAAIELGKSYGGVIDDTKSLSENLISLEDATEQGKERLLELDQELNEMKLRALEIDVKVGEADFAVMREKYEEFTNDISQWGSSFEETGANLFAEKIGEAVDPGELAGTIQESLKSLWTDPKFNNYTATQKAELEKHLLALGDKQSEILESSSLNAIAAQESELVNLSNNVMNNNTELNRLQAKEITESISAEEKAKLESLRNQNSQFSEFAKKRLASELSEQDAIALMAKLHGKTNEEAAKFLGISKDIAQAMEGAAEDAKSLGGSFKESMSVSSKKFTTELYEEAAALNRLEQARKTGSKEEIANAEKLLKERRAITTAAYKDDAANKKVLKIVKGQYIEEKKKGKQTKKTTDLLAKQYTERTKALSIEYESNEATIEMVRIRKGNEKTILTEVAAQERKLKKLEKEREILEDVYKITTDAKTQEVSFGVSFKKGQDPQKIEDKLSALNTKIIRETSKGLELALDAKIEITDLENEIENIQKDLTFQKLEMDIELGLESPDALVKLLEDDLKGSKSQIDQLKSELSELTKIAAPSDGEMLNMRKIAKELVELEQTSLDQQQEIANEKRAIYDEEYNALVTSNDKIIAAKEDQLEKSRTLSDQLISITEKHLLSKADQSKDSQITQLEALKEAEVITELEYNARKEQLELDHQKKLTAIAGIAQGERLELDRQIELEKLNSQKKAMQAELELATKNKDLIRVQELEAALGEMDSAISEKGNLLLAHAGTIQEGTQAIFANMGDPEAMKESFRSVMGVLSGALTQYASAAVTSMLLGQLGISGATTGLVGLLLIPALKGLISVAMGQLLKPVLSGLTSFSFGGRVSEPTAAVVGDNPYSDEWILRDGDIKAMLKELLTKNNQLMAGLFNDIMTDYNYTVNNALSSVQAQSGLTAALAASALNRESEINDLNAMAQEYGKVGEEISKLYSQQQQIDTMLQSSQMASKDVATLLVTLQAQRANELELQKAKFDSIEALGYRQIAEAMATKIIGLTGDSLSASVVNLSSQHPETQANNSVVDSLMKSVLKSNAMVSRKLDRVIDLFASEPRRTELILNGEKIAEDTTRRQKNAASKVIKVMGG